MNLKKTKKGFTLIELIVVIAVLAILAAVAIPMVSSWVTQAQNAEGAANARTIELAMKAYLADGDNDDTTITSANYDDALTAFGLPTDKIAGSKSDYTVATNGTTTFSNTGSGDGTISLAP